MIPSLSESSVGQKIFLTLVAYTSDVSYQSTGSAYYLINQSGSELKQSPLGVPTLTKKYPRVLPPRYHTLIRRNAHIIKIRIDEGLNKIVGGVPLIKFKQMIF